MAPETKNAPAGFRRASEDGDLLGGWVNSEAKVSFDKKQALHAELAGDDMCSAAGIITRGSTPVLALCRELLAAGINPDVALHVHRRGVLALRVGAIGEAAALTVKTAGNGAPIFRRHEGATASPVRSGEAACYE
jgi:hypothetical protein